MPRLYVSVRPGARYFNSLRLLDRGKQLDPAMFTKSGIMVGLGRAWASSARSWTTCARPMSISWPSVSIYSPRPSINHVVDRFVTPEELKRFESMAYAKGFLMVSALPLTRSS